MGVKLLIAEQAIERSQRSREKQVPAGLGCEVGRVAGPAGDPAQRPLWSPSSFYVLLGYVVSCQPFLQWVRNRTLIPLHVRTPDSWDCYLAPCPVSGPDYVAGASH